MNSEEDVVITIAAPNLIKRKRHKKAKILARKNLFGKNHGYSVGLLMAYTALLLWNSGLKAKALIKKFYD